MEIRDFQSSWDLLLSGDNISGDVRDLTAEGGCYRTPIMHYGVVRTKGHVTIARYETFQKIRDLSEDTRPFRS